MKLLRLAALLLPLACSSSTEPADGPRVDFAVSQASYSPLRQGAEAHAAAGKIEITGDIVTGDPCVVVRGETDVAARRVSLTVVARHKEGGCITVVADFAYRATFDGLETGTYAVVVAHAWEDPSGKRTGAQQVLSTTVVVP